MADLARPITTQEELDELIERRLQRARSQWERESGVSEAERQRDEARQRARKAERDALDRLIRRDARDVLTGMGVADRRRQDLILKLADLSGVEAGEGGEPNRKQIVDAVKALHKDTPDLFGSEARVEDSAPDADGGTGRTGETGGDGPLTLDRIRAMSPEQINSAWDRVSAFLSGERK